MPSAVPVITSGIVLLLGLMYIGYCIDCLCEENKSVKVAQYEDAYYSHHEAAITRQQQNPGTAEEIPLTFARQESESILNLCTQYTNILTLQHYVNKWGTLRSYQPSLETNYIRFRRLAVARRSPVRVATVRCSERIAIVEAGDGTSGYVLTKVESNSDSAINEFNITGKFACKQPDAVRTMDPVFVVGGDERYQVR